MELRNCNICNREFSNEGEICNICRQENTQSDKMRRLEGTIDALATLKTYKELKK